MQIAFHLLLVGGGLDGQFAVDAAHDAGTAGVGGKGLFPVGRGDGRGEMVDSASCCEWVIAAGGEHGVDDIGRLAGVTELPFQTANDEIAGVWNGVVRQESAVL